MRNGNLNEKAFSMNNRERSFFDPTLPAIPGSDRISDIESGVSILGDAYAKA
jgi:hypothetical protein